MSPCAVQPDTTTAMCNRPIYSSAMGQACVPTNNHCIHSQYKKKKACLVLLLNTALTLSLFVLLLFGHLTAAAIAASLVTCFQACVLHISFYLFCFCFSLWHAFNTDYNEHLLFPVDFYEHSFAVFHNAALVWPFIFLVLLLALIDNFAF